MSITAKVKYLKSVLRFLVFVSITLASVTASVSEEGNVISFQKVLKYYPLLPQLIDPFPPQEKTLSRKSSHPFWNGRFLDATKKLRKIKKYNETGLIDGTFIMYYRFGQNDLQIPAVISLDWYRSQAIQENTYYEFKKIFIKKIERQNQGSEGHGKALTIFSKKIGETDVELSINGNMSVAGDLVFEDKDLITTSQKESKDWDIEIEQTQRFNIDGNIGNRYFIDISQDSEADFTWENNLYIEYRGDKNGILQKAEAGNINLSLEGMDAVNLGGDNSSLFGIKTVHQLGPVAIQSVIAREQVKKSEKEYNGGSEESSPISIKDYQFIVDRYFFIDKTFRNNFYPLDPTTNTHQYNAEYVIGKYEVYQKVITSEGDPVLATAYLDPENNLSYSISGSWKRLEEDIDYEIDRILGYIRVNSATDAIAIAYTTTSFNPNTQLFNDEPKSTGTNFKSEYVECINSEGHDADCEINLKLLKDINKSTPISKTWALMLKNVYSLGGSNIDPSGLEIEIVHDEGGGAERTHSNSGYSFLSIFGLDSEDQNHQKIPDGCGDINNPCTGDGKIDLYGTFLNLQYGELILPAHLPFAYDNTLNSENTYWGNTQNDLKDILVNLTDHNGNFSDENDNGPAMYYDTNDDKIIEEHEFVIKVKTSSRSSSLSLGFMIVEGSETVRLGDQILEKDVDYTIDYFSGTINFISQNALDPTAEISVSYEENELISFDQKLLLGTHMKYTFGEKNYLAGGMFYYKQSIVDEKVDIGYEPMNNFVWNLKGKYQEELGFLTRAVDFLPLIQTTKPSTFNLEGNYAEISPNPNPLGQAFIDDFESSKRTSSLSIMQRQWKMASPPDSTSQDSSQTLRTRGRMIWYNPYQDEPTKNIWPEQSTSTQANNNTTKIMYLETDFRGNNEDTLWNGIMIPLYSSEYNQSQSKYLDIWLNANLVVDNTMKIYIDIGNMSEDWNINGILDTEDEPVYGPGMGDGILSDGEDIGVDNCTDSYEDGWGGCLCKSYNDARYESNLEGIYDQTKEYCIDPEAVKYINALEIDSIFVNPNIVPYAPNDDPPKYDPNGDNWCYNTTGCSSTTDYSRANGTEGNGQAMGFRYPDTEDMNKNNTLDIRNNYFTVSINPKQDFDPLVVTETKDDNSPTGWKLYRIPLNSFDEVGDPEWNDVRSFRIRVESADINNSSILKIAKIELVENDWQELGVGLKDDLDDLDDLNKDYEYFSVEVINTDESYEYNEKLKCKNCGWTQPDIVREYDEYNEIDMKEQSLVFSFIKNTKYNNNPTDSPGGLEVNHAALIKNTFPSLTSDKSQSYFAYEKMKMYIFAGDPVTTPICDWCREDSSNVDFLFRFGKDNSNYYEVRQPVYEGWDDKNHLDINIEKLTQLKIPIIKSPSEHHKDAGMDGIFSDYENGCGGGNKIYKYTSILDSLNIEADSIFVQDTLFVHEEQDTIIVCGEGWWEEKNCIYCTSDDPNGDGGTDSLNPNGTEKNDKFDYQDFNNDGLITSGEAEEAEEDFNGDGIYTPHPFYDYDNDLYIWDNQSDIEEACHHCSELHIKGTPAINNIQSIIMGVINNSDQRIYGKVLVNELRMTGVKKKKGRSYSISGSLGFADLMTISGSYNRKDSHFHKLQQRLGTGNLDESYSTTFKLHPNIILPTRWGIKTPITLGYSKSYSTPQYHTGSDILTDPNDAAIEEIQTINEKISFSTSFNKSSRSTNWFLKRSIDNISLNYSAIQTNKSNNQIFNEEKLDYEASAGYTYSWGKENYFSPFSFTKDWFIIGNILGESRYYFTPDKFNANIQFNENSSWKIQRINFDDTTKSYSFNMKRKFTLNHKFTKTLGSNYSRQIDSNVDEFRYDKWKIVENMDPGLIMSISEKFTNTYAPVFLKWLNPNITYNPIYNWNLNIISDTTHTANIKSSNSFKTKINLSIKDIIELIYTPDKKGRSSSGRGRSQSSSRSSKNNKKINIKNPVARFVLGKFHFLVSKLNKISATYTYTTSHDYYNIYADLSPSYLYRFGLQRSPLDDFGALFDADTINNLVGSSADSYGNDFNTGTSISLIQTIVTNLDYKYSNSLSIPSTASIAKNESFSYYPVGNRGEEGFIMPNWSVNWSQIEKWWFLNKLFKSISLNHGFNGEYSKSYKDVNDDGRLAEDEIQNEQYNFSYSPILGITTKTKGRNPITFKANYNLNQIIKNIDESTERNHNQQFNSSISYRKSGGLTIPIFFFDSFYIPNAIDFSINFNYDIDQKLMTSTRVEDISEFNEQSKNTSWSIKPNMNYSFTRWINGNFYFVYGISENKTSGSNEEKDFGFNLNIKIQG